jgi:SNF2 family DNA or RNA helicase
MEINNVSDAARKYAKALAAIAKYNPTSETATALGLAVKAQLHAAHTILGERATSTDDGITGSLEIGEDPEDFVVRLVGMHESESGQSRKEWLNELRNMNNWKLKEASRVKALLEIIRHARQTYPSEKIIVFSCFLRFLDIVNQVIKDEFEIDCLRYDGTMGSNEKERVQWAFSDSTGHSILLITSGAGGVGLNLQSASVVIQTEVWWNHNVERQAYARCVRHGQAKEVKVFRMLGSNSAIDTIILKCQLRKTKENDSIMAGLIRRHDAPLVVPEYKAGIW